MAGLDVADPSRQCIVCQKKKSKPELMRITRTPEGQIEIDKRQCLPGRGCYVCASSQCIELACKRDLVSRILGQPVPKSIYIQLASIFSERASDDTSMQNILGFAARGRKLVFGVTAVKSAINKGQVKLVVYDQTAAASTMNTIFRACVKGNVPNIPFVSTDTLDRAVGKVNCRCVGITDSGFAGTLRQLSLSAQRLENQNTDNLIQNQ